VLVFWKEEFKKIKLNEFSPKAAITHKDQGGKQNYHQASLSTKATGIGT